MSLEPTANIAQTDSVGRDAIELFPADRCGLAERRLAIRAELLARDRSGYTTRSVFVHATVMSPNTYSTMYRYYMRHAFLSAPWFDKVDELIAAAGDLQIPAEMKAVKINITVTSPRGDALVFLSDGLFSRGHRDGTATTLTLTEELARKVFVDGDNAAGVQAFLAGEMKADGDLAGLVAMSTVEPSAAQKRLTVQIAAITE